MTANELVQIVVAQTWQVTLLGVVVWAITRIMARNRPHLAYMLWLVVLIKFVTPPIWSSPTGVFCWLQTARPTEQAPVARVGDLEVAFGEPETVDEEDFSAVKMAALPPAEKIELKSFLVPGLLGVWLTGSVAMITLSGLSWLGCWRRLRRTRHSPDPQLEEMLAKLSRSFGLRRPVRLSITSSSLGPAVMGLVRPTIVLPLVIAQGKSAADLEPILAHELAHVRRGDLWVGLFQLIAQTLWWFHPLVWLASRMLSREAERCCDEEVVAALGCSPGRYARSLLEVLELKCQLTSLPAFPGMRPVEITNQRLERIMKLGQGCRRRTPWWCWVMMLALVAMTLPGAAMIAAEDKPATTEPSTKMDVQTFLTKAPTEKNKTRLPTYVIEPPDILLIDTLKLVPKKDSEHRTDEQKIRGEHLVGPDGTVNLGIYGTVYVTNLTIAKAKEAIEEQLSQYFDKPKVSVDVFAFNSKVYYIITEGSGLGDTVVRVPITGNETVLDALAEGNHLNGFGELATKKVWIARPAPGSKGSDQVLPVNLNEITKEGISTWIARPAPGSKGSDQVLPVNLNEITKEGISTTNYQVLPNDRVFISEEPPVKTYALKELLLTAKQKWGIDEEEAKRLITERLEQYLNISPPNPGNGTLQGQRRMVWKDQSLLVLTDDHKSIKNGLTMIRAYGFGQIAIDVRFGSGDAKSIEAIHADWITAIPESESVEEANKGMRAEPILGNLAETLPNRASFVIEQDTPIGTAVIDEKQFNEALMQLQGDRHANILQAPKLILFNGQWSNVADSSQTPFVVGMRDGKPQIRIVKEGTTISLRPILRKDGVRLDFISEFSKISSVATRKVRSKYGSQLTVQSPTVARTRLQSSIDLPLGKTLLIGGLKPDDESKSIIIVVRTTVISPKRSDPIEDANVDEDRTADKVGSISEAPPYNEEKATPTNRY